MIFELFSMFFYFNGYMKWMNNISKENFNLSKNKPKFKIFLFTWIVGYYALSVVLYFLYLLVRRNIPLTIILTMWIYLMWDAAFVVMIPNAYKGVKTMMFDILIAGGVVIGLTFYLFKYYNSYLIKFLPFLIIICALIYLIYFYQVLSFNRKEDDEGLILNIGDKFHFDTFLDLFPQFE